MTPGLGKIIVKVHISRYFESSEINFYIVDKTCCIDYADTWSSKLVH